MVDINNFSERLGRSTLVRVHLDDDIVNCIVDLHENREDGKVILKSLSKKICSQVNNSPLSVESIIITSNHKFDYNLEKYDGISFIADVELCSGVTRKCLVRFNSGRKAKAKQLKSEEYCEMSPLEFEPRNYRYTLRNFDGIGESRPEGGEIVDWQEEFRELEALSQATTMDAVGAALINGLRVESYSEDAHNFCRNVYDNTSFSLSDLVTLRNFITSGEASARLCELYYDPRRRGECGNSSTTDIGNDTWVSMEEYNLMREVRAARANEIMP